MICTTTLHYITIEVERRIITYANESIITKRVDYKSNIVLWGHWGLINYQSYIVLKAQNLILANLLSFHCKLFEFVEHGRINNPIYKVWSYLSLGICSYLRYWKQFVGRIENRYMHLQAYVLSGLVIYGCEVIAQNKTPWSN